MTTYANDDHMGETLQEVTEALSRHSSYDQVYHQHWHQVPMPSLVKLSELVERLRDVLFPGYFGKPDISPKTMQFHVGSHLDAVARLLTEQIIRGTCFTCKLETRGECEDCEEKGRQKTMAFLRRLPEIRRLLATDVEAAFVGDPASVSPDETIFCYPSIMAMTNHRIAHELHKLGVELIPRIIGEMAHSRTGIDIHPGASIGEYFFIDHGTGTVVGETCVIGKHVRLYQGVTLGAKSFPRDEDGNPIKGIARHPIVEDNVIIYSGATILGRVTIGNGAVIGGNVWLTRDVQAGARVLQRPVEQMTFANGAGI